LFLQIPDSVQKLDWVKLAPLLRKAAFDRI